MTSTTARKIAGSSEFQKLHREWLARKDTAHVLEVLCAILCRPVMLPMGEVTAERSIFANAFAAGVYAFADVCQDVKALEVVDQVVPERFEAETGKE